jgi:vacuolar-type H+-ATPase catalytic subunit A/Vma1
VRDIMLRQNAYHPHDGASSVEKTYALALAMRELYHSALALLDAGTSMGRIDLEPARRALARLRDAAPDELERFREEAMSAARVSSRGSRVSSDGAGGS